MAKYSSERKDNIIKQLLPPISCTVRELSEKEGIPQVTLYNWRSRNQSIGGDVSSKKISSSSKWSAEQKVAIVVATFGLNAEELNVYCREKGLYPCQVKEWKSACLLGQANSKTMQKENEARSRIATKTIKKLEKELNRKEKALAEAAALLTLGKKYDALWSDKEES